MVAVSPVGLRPPCKTATIDKATKPADDPLIFCQSLFKQTEPLLRGLPKRERPPAARQRHPRRNRREMGLRHQGIHQVGMPECVSPPNPNFQTSGCTIQADYFPVDRRPWGWFESLVVGDRFQVKRIQVQPGAALSLQSHHHRAEHWIVVAGTARGTIDGQDQILIENQSAYIPLGARHRLENPGKVPLTLIEVQTDSYLGEDDILRYEDRYARN